MFQTKSNVRLKFTQLPITAAVLTLCRFEVPQEVPVHCACNDVTRIETEVYNKGFNTRTKENSGSL